MRGYAEAVGVDSVEPLRVVIDVQVSGSGRGVDRDGGVADEEVSFLKWRERTWGTISKKSNQVTSSVRRSSVCVVVSPDLECDSETSRFERAPQVVNVADELLRRLQHEAANARRTLNDARHGASAEAGDDASLDVEV